MGGKRRLECVLLGLILIFALIQFSNETNAVPAYVQPLKGYAWRSAVRLVITNSTTPLTTDTIQTIIQDDLGIWNLAEQEFLRNLNASYTYYTPLVLVPDPPLIRGFYAAVYLHSLFDSQYAATSYCPLIRSSEQFPQPTFCRLDVWPYNITGQPYSLGFIHVTIMRELGHILGLANNNVTNDLMCGCPSGFNATNPSTLNLYALYALNVLAQYGFYATQVTLASTIPYTQNIQSARPTGPMPAVLPIPEFPIGSLAAVMGAMATSLILVKREEASRRKVCPI